MSIFKDKVLLITGSIDVAIPCVIYVFVAVALKQIPNCEFFSMEN